MNSIHDIKDTLKKELENEQGTITIRLAKINLDIQAKDIIGNAIQEWLGAWFDKKGIQYRVLKNTQEFPDYIIKFKGVESFLEVKTWNYEKGPAFDLANFNSYIDSLNDNPLKIDADYLVFGYIANDKGFMIKNIFTKYYSKDFEIYLNEILANNINPLIEEYANQRHSISKER